MYLLLKIVWITVFYNRYYKKITLVLNFTTIPKSNKLERADSIITSFRKKDRITQFQHIWVLDWCTTEAGRTNQAAAQHGCTHPRFTTQSSERSSYQTHTQRFAHHANQSACTGLPFSWHLWNKTQGNNPKPVTGNICDHLMASKIISLY